MKFNNINDIIEYFSNQDEYEEYTAGDILQMLRDIPKVQYIAKFTKSDKKRLQKMIQEDLIVLLPNACEITPCAQPERLTDAEQRIFLAAMGREEKVCKQVDEKCRDYREPNMVNLVFTCHEIVRKVKRALWT